MITVTVCYQERYNGNIVDLGIIDTSGVRHSYRERATFRDLGKDLRVFSYKINNTKDLTELLKANNVIFNRRQEQFELHKDLGNGRVFTSVFRVSNINTKDFMSVAYNEHFCD